MSNKTQTSASRGQNINGQRSIDYYDNSGRKTETKAGGHAAWRNNNPGNLKWNGKSDKDVWENRGAIGTDGTFAIFPNRQAGLNAKMAEWNRSKYQEMSISEGINTYAPKSDGNNPDRYIAHIHEWTGLDASKKVKDLTSSEFQSLMEAINREESHDQNTKGQGTIIDHTKSTIPSQQNSTNDQSNPGKRSDALDQPITSWSEADARQVMESPAYQRPSHPQHADAQEKVTEWHRMNYGDDAAEQDATGRMIPPDQIADSRGDNGNSSGGSVHVSSYTRSVKGHSVSVSDYWRRSARG